MISGRTEIAAGFKPAASPAHAARCTESAVRTPVRSVVTRRRSALKTSASVRTSSPERPRASIGAASTIPSAATMETSTTASVKPTTAGVEPSTTAAVTAVLGGRWIRRESKS